MNAISQFCKDYYNEIPEHSGRKICFSALSSFVFGVILIVVKSPTNTLVNLTRAVGASAIALIVTTIHALTIPIFNYAFKKSEDSESYSPSQEFMHIISSMAVTELLINHTTPFKVNLSTSLSYNCPHLVLNPNLFKVALGLIAQIAVQLSHGPFPSVSISIPQIEKFINFSKQTTPIYIVI